MNLNDLRPDEGSTKKRKRVGRGIAAGQGKTAGRGTKGQNARSGGGKGPYFEGGQLPLARRLPIRRGFTNHRKVYYSPVNVGSFTELLDVEGDEEITPEIMLALGLIRKVDDPIVVLGDGEIDVALTIKAHRFSKSAKQKIEAAGGKAVIIPLEQ